MANLATPWKMRFFFWQKLPSLLFWGVRIISVTPSRGQVTIPFGWRTQNPFRSTYFAALSGAGELAAGILAMIAIEGRGPVSMLIVGLEVEFLKKATTLTIFTCNDGDKIQQAVQQALETGEGVTTRVASIGVQEDGTEVARVHLTWSFKRK